MSAKKKSPRKTARKAPANDAPATRADATSRRTRRVPSRPWRARLLEALETLIAGTVLGFGAVVGPEPVPALFGLAAFRLILLRQPPSARRGFVLGLIGGTATNTVALHWTVSVIVDFSSIPTSLAVLASSLLWIAQGGVLASVGFFHEAVRSTRYDFDAPPTAPQNSHWAPPVLFAAAMAVSFSWIPFLFPWKTATAAAGWIAWAQIAEFGGAPILDFLMGLTAAAIGDLAIDLRRVRRQGLPLRAFFIGRPLRFLALALAIPMAVGWWRLETARAERAEAPEMLIGAVQVNASIEYKRDPANWPVMLADLQRLSQELEAAGAELVVWSENAYPYPFPRGRERDFSPPYRLREGMRGPLLTGAVTYGGRCERWNSVLAMDATGQVTGVADKVKLLAFGEYVPLWHYLPPLQERFRCPGLTPGQVNAILPLGRAQVGVLNCYEDVLDEPSREVAGRGADVLINVTNDAWFGDTREPHLHHLVARLRSIETRRDMVRSVNTGVSGHILSTGENAVYTPTYEQTAFIARARLLTGETFWVHYGDVVTFPCALLLVGFVVVGRRRRT